MAKLGREARKRRGLAPKKVMVREMVDILKQGQGFVLCNNNGLSLAQATALRKRARENRVAVKIIKNTLLARALDETGVDSSKLEKYLSGTTVVFVGLEDPVSPAKLVMDYSKDNEKLEVKGGYFDGEVLSFDRVKALAELPSREQLIQRLLGSMNAPVQNFVYALNAVVSKPVYMLDALRRKKEESGEAA